MDFSKLVKENVMYKQHRAGMKSTGTRSTVTILKVKGCLHEQNGECIKSEVSVQTTIKTRKPVVKVLAAYQGKCQGRAKSTAPEKREF